VQESTAPKVYTSEAIPFGPNYGYLWWIGNAQGRDFYFANGYAGQFIIVVPALDLVVVATSDWHGLSNEEASAQWSKVIGLIVDRVLPSVQP
jgi:CubicO group peptidase (beta-lactamase class C family)